MHHRRNTMEACSSDVAVKDAANNSSSSFFCQSSSQLLSLASASGLNTSNFASEYPLRTNPESQFVSEIAANTQGPKRRYAKTPYMEKLEKTLDVSKFIEQVERYIDMPIKIPSNMTVSASLRERPQPGKAKRDLFSVEEIWESAVDRKTEISTLYNTNSVGERKWLLDLLLVESDPDSGGEEEFTDEDIKTMLKIHRERRKFQKKYHSDPMNLQYTYYGAGLISEHDRFPEHQSNVVKRMNVQHGK